MNIPFFSKYGTKYAPSSGAQAGTDLTTLTPVTQVTSFLLLQKMQELQLQVSTTTMVTHPLQILRTYLPKRSCCCCRSYRPQVQVTSGDVSVVYQGDVILGRLAMGADFLNPVLVLNCSLEQQLSPLHLVLHTQLTLIFYFYTGASAPFFLWLPQLLTPIPNYPQ